MFNYLNQEKEKILSIMATKCLLVDHILFLHDMSECDTASAMFNQGKIKFIHPLKKILSVQPSMYLLKNPYVNQQVFADTEEKFLVSLYSGKTKGWKII